MDFKRLVESEEYSKEDLTDNQRSYIEGMEWSLGVVEDAVEEASDDDAILERLISEIRQETVEEIKNYLYASICEAIVCFADDNYVENEEQESGTAD